MTISFTLKTRELAEQLIASETVGSSARLSSTEIQVRIPNRLRQPICSLAGTAAFHALLSRALALSKIEFPRLAAAKLNRDGCLEGLSNIDPPLSGEEAAKGEVILIGNIVELLYTLLGETLALRLIQGVWPDASFVSEKFVEEGTA